MPWRPARRSAHRPRDGLKEQACRARPPGGDSVSVDADSRQAGTIMDEAADFPTLGTGGVTKVTGEIEVIGPGDFAEVTERSPGMGADDVAHAFPDLGTEPTVKIFRVTGDFPVLNPGAVRKAFPDMHVGDIVKISGGLLDVEASQPVTIWSGKLDAVAIAPAARDRAPQPEEQISATVSYVEESAVYLSVRSDEGAGDLGW